MKTSKRSRVRAVVS